jgi:hypothetical protein
MHISPEDLEDFRWLYTAAFGQELTQEEASEMAGRVADLYLLLAETLPSETKSAATPHPETVELPSPS